MAHLVSILIFFEGHNEHEALGAAVNNDKGDSCVEFNSDTVMKSGFVTDTFLDALLIICIVVINGINWVLHSKEKAKGYWQCLTFDFY